jgi:hypothetical protein
MPTNTSESTLIDETAIEESIPEAIPEEILEELPELPLTDGED